MTSPLDMPPGVSGSVDIGSGASRVHNTKPSGRGAPDATPRLNGWLLLQLGAPARRSTAGAPMMTKPAPAARVNKRRRVSRGGKRPLGIGIQWLNNRAVL